MRTFIVVVIIALAVVIVLVALRRRTVEGRDDYLNRSGTRSDDEWRSARGNKYVGNISAGESTPSPTGSSVTDSEGELHGKGAGGEDTGGDGG